ncbi:MAG: DUF72 domain-containing protein [Armatimonadetes bacterium]|nr:DUF72 domain-containing protein [Armatimonadota bacterium]
MAEIRIGLSGYAYAPWRGEGRFYPPELKPKEFLAFYAERYRAVEMDGTWYKMPSREQLANLATAPEGFQFTFKAHRQVSHMARLKPAALDPMRFFLYRLSFLAPTGKVGAVLVQLPPNFKFDAARVRDFFEAAPRKYTDIPEWEYEGETHGVDPALKGTPEDAIRYALEFRHESWRCDESDQLLTDLNVGCVAAETDEAEAWLCESGDVRYCRLRKSDYGKKELTVWAERMKKWQASGLDTLAFLKHEDDGSPWIWADELLSILG